MKKLLSAKDSRVLIMIESLKEDSVSISKLMEMTNVSLKTMHSDIEYVNTLITPIKINKNENSILSLYIPKNYAINYIYPKILENSVEFLLLEKIFFNEEYTINILSEELFISPSSLRRIISRLNNVFSRLNISISLSPLRVIGNESSIRNFYIQYFLEKFPNGVYPFNDFQKKVLDLLINYYTKKNDISLNYTDLEKLRISSIVALIRMKNNHYLDFKPKINSNVSSISENNSLLNRSFKSVFKIPLTKAVIINIVPFLFNGKFFFSYDQLVESSKTDIEVKKIKANFKLIIEKVSTKFEIPCPNKEMLQVDLCTAYFLNYGPPFVLYDFYTEFINYIKVYNPDLLLYITSQFKKNFKNVNLEDYHLNNYIYILISHWKDLYLSVENRSKAFTIGIFYNTDFEQNLMVKNILDFKFGNQVKSTVISKRNIQEVINSFPNYDLVITNISDLPYNNILCFSSFPTKKDMDNVQHFMKNF